jgi:hypothetical protein
MRGGLVLLAGMTFMLTVLAAYSLRQFRTHPPTSDPLARQLKHDLVMMVGMISVGWCITCVALLLNPTLGAEGDVTAVALYSISRGCMMLVFWEVIGFGAFLLRQVRGRL